MSKLIIALIFIIFNTLSLFAKEIPVDKALQVAQSLKTIQIAQNSALKNLPASFTLAADIKINNSNKTAIYIFDLDSQGFVMVAGDDNVFPVLGYSFNNNLDVNNMAPALKAWLKNYVNQISYAVEHNFKEYGVSDAWNYFLNESENFIMQKNTSVGPLLLTTWNQDHFYNAYCPEDPEGPGGRVYAGCVATAMGQVMKYYNYPQQGTGTYTYYDWDYGYQTADFGNTTYMWSHMTNSLNTHNNAVAELLYHCGVAVDMGYSPFGSGAQSEDVAPAMINYFGYSSNMNIKNKNQYTQQQWIDMLKANLDQLMPLYYSGYSNEGGHAFNFDGYNQDANGTHFHINWGWGGYGNGFFLINNLASPGGNFNSWHQAVFNMIPAQNYPENCANLKTINGTSGTFDDGSGIYEYQNNLSCSWLIDPAVNVVNIKLTFDWLDTEIDNDIVIIYDGDNTSAPILGSFSGNTMPTQLISTGNKMLITFTTNASVKAQGWSVSYTTTKPVYCNNLTVLNAPSGTISDGSNSYNYNTMTNCRWRIEPPNTGTITIQFVDFDIQPYEDVLEIFDVSSSPYQLIDSYTGSQIPQTKTYTASKLLLWFKSANNPKTGWSLNYTSTVASINNINLSEKIDIFPNPAHNVLNVNFETLPPNCILNIYNLNGVLVKSFMPLKNTNTFDIADLSNGIYQLIVINNQSNLMKRFIKY